MRYTAFVLGLFIVLGLVFIFPVSAQTTTNNTNDTVAEELPDPGLTPDSPFYFLDDFWKSVRLTFTRSDEKKIELRMEFAREKLAEMQVMTEEKKEEALARATVRYEEHLAEAEDRLANADFTDEQQARIEERLAAAAERHQAALDRIEERADKRMRHLIDRARDASHENRVKALERLREHRPEKAAEFAGNAIEKRAEHLRSILENDDLSDEMRARLEEQLAHLEELSVLGESALKRLSGEVRDRLQSGFNEARARAETSLQEIIERAPEEALQRLQNALERIRNIDNPRELLQIRSELEDHRQERREQHGDLRDREFCIQVITPARNPETGQVRQFPTPCDVPEGWELISPAQRSLDRDGPFEDLRIRTIDRVEEIRRDILPEFNPDEFRTRFQERLLEN